MLLISAEVSKSNTLDKETKMIVTIDTKDLSDDLNKLLGMAARARLNVQAPYSRFAVGAAVMSNGKFHAGCNVERATYSQTTHAEQCAIDGLTAKYGVLKIKTIVIVGGPQGKNFTCAPCWPCGHCRQIIWENSDGDPSVQVITPAGDGKLAVLTIGELFPYPFGPKDLGINIFH